MYEGEVTELTPEYSEAEVREKGCVWGGGGDCWQE